MDLWLFFIIFLFFILFLNSLKRRQSRSVQMINKIPGPRGYPFFGNILSIPRKHDEIWLHLSAMVWEHTNYFNFFTTHLGGISFQNSKVKLLNNQGFIDKGKSYELVRDFLEEGLILASGKKWKKNRRLLMPSFHPRILDRFFGVFCNNADILCQVWRNELKCCQSLGKEMEINVIPYIFRCTLDVICETAMGVKINALTTNSELETVVGRIGSIAVSKFTSPWQFFPDWVYRYVSSSGREWYQHLSTVKAFTKKLINERKSIIEKQILFDDEIDHHLTVKRIPFLDLLLIEAQKGADLSDDQIQHESITFMAAGHDTTAVLMTWFLYLMGTNIKHQERVREELELIFGDSDRQCTMEDLAEMTYLECCIKETLRMYPSVAFIERVINKDVELEGYNIQAGTSITMLVYALHHNEESFPDPFVFKPERFQKIDGVYEHHPFAYIPFAAGPRNCIGQRYAMLEAKAILSALMRRFQFTYDLAKHGPARPGNEIVLKPKGGMPLIITPIVRPTTNLTTSRSY